MKVLLIELLNELQLLQDDTVHLVRQIPEEDYNKQFHPDLSPLGWHLGHCIFIELYWIREQCLQETVDDSLKALYFPELSHKPSRGEVLPEKQELIRWAENKQSENRRLLESLCNKKEKHLLLENNFLIHFLIQHYSQHIETMHMVLTEMQLQKDYTNFIAEDNNQQLIASEFIEIEAGTYEVGSNNKEQTYDNEQPVHEVTLAPFSISNSPVSNKEYLQFIDNNGYSTEPYWSKQGWEWINETQYKHPHHWRVNNSRYYGINHNGAYALKDEQPVYGLSYYEAEAFANWKSMRLPHEHEWEVAKLSQQLEKSGLVWEWCSNTFYPYHNFKPYPYDGYSVPYFDNKHYVLRGGSRYTKERIKRTSFRNYYTADKRHMFAGLRLVKD